MMKTINLSIYVDLLCNYSYSNAAVCPMLAKDTHLDCLLCEFPLSRAKSPLY